VAIRGVAAGDSASPRRSIESAARRRSQGAVGIRAACGLDANRRGRDDASTVIRWVGAAAVWSKIATISLCVRCPGIVTAVGRGIAAVTRVDGGSRVGIATDFGATVAVLVQGVGGGTTYGQ